MTIPATTPSPFSTRLHMTTLLSLDVGNQPIKRRLRAKPRVSFEQGAFIQWLDADDILGSNNREQVFLLQNHSPHYAAHSMNFKVPSRMGDRSEMVLPAESLWRLAGKDAMIGSHCWMTPRTIATSAGSWDESLNINQDGEYFARVVASAKRVLFDDQVEVYYRREGGGVSKFYAEKADSLFRSIESMANTALQIEDSNRMRQMISNRWQHFIYTSYPYAPNLIVQAKRQPQKLPQPSVDNPNAVSLAAKHSAPSSVGYTRARLHFVKIPIDMKQRIASSPPSSPARTPGCGRMMLCTMLE